MISMGRLLVPPYSNYLITLFINRTAGVAKTTYKHLILLKVRPVGDIGATYILFDKRSEALLASFFLSASFV
jgi:hypothetical protein